jgi:CspA family cold shock protein
MPTGYLRYFLDSRGYGFLRRDGSDEDVFAHWFVLRKAGIKRLEQGQRFQFDIAQRADGKEYATDVRPID